jgi:murein DD-endopeptidase MepM/ murein hydrolase activator NlpD
MAIRLTRFAPLLAAALGFSGAGLALAASRHQAPKTPAQPPLTFSHRARALAPGEAVLLTFKASGGALTSVRGTAFGAPFTAFAGASPDTWHALVGIDLAIKPGPSRIDVEARLADGTLLRAGGPMTVAPKAFPTRRLSVAPEFVTPPAAEQARIERERVLLGRVFSAVSPQRLWGDGFARPAGGDVISLFGARSVYNGQARSPHRGLDFRGAVGTPVAAPARGQVVLTGDLYFSGSTVILDHGLGVFSLLCHLSRIDVHEGSLVTAGDVIGAIGATGRVTGPHLHWTLRIGAASVDPLSVLAVAGVRR